MAENRPVLVVGSINTDITLDVSRLPGPGETVLATGRHTAPGGKGANQAVAAAALGARVAFVGAVGDDAEGRASLDHLERRGIDTSGIAVVPDVPSGSAVILVDASTENLIVVAPGSNASVDPVPTAAHAAAAGPCVMVAQLEVPVRAVEAAADALPAGSTFILNPAPMPDDASTVAALVARADVVCPNRSELGQMAGRPEPRTLDEVDACVASLRTEAAVVVTLGADGAVSYPPGGGERTHHPPTDDVPVDTSGAGDAFCGTLAAALAAGHPLTDAVRLAIDVSGQSTGLRGAQLPADFESRVSVVATPAL